MYFVNEGKENTEKVAAIVADYVKKNDIKHVVVASVSGYTPMSS